MLPLAVKKDIKRVYFPGALEEGAPKDEAPAENLGAVKGLANLALALADPLALALPVLAVVALALADPLTLSLAVLAVLAEVVLAEEDLAGGCCDRDRVSSFLDLAGGMASFRDLAGALRTYKETW